MAAHVADGDWTSAASLGRAVGRLGVTPTEDSAYSVSLSVHLGLPQPFYSLDRPRIRTG